MTKPMKKQTRVRRWRVMGADIFKLGYQENSFWKCSIWVVTGLKWESELCEHVSFPGPKESKCKDCETELCLACSKSSHEARIVGEQRAKRRIYNESGGYW